MKEKDKLPDIQAIKDKRGIGISRVGIENVDFPMLVAGEGEDTKLVYAKIDLFTSLKHQIKGTNMSRFMEILMEWKYKILSDDSLEDMLWALKDKMGDVEDVYVDIAFKYFLPKISPVSKKHSVMAYDCAYIGKLRGNRFNLKIRVKVLATSNCPCSKEISDYGAHGQRSLATVTVEPLKEKHISLEKLITMIEKSSSCEVYPLLKRPDEKYVTEKAYNNPKFVEDAVRDIAKGLQSSKKIRAYKIKVSNQESIHAHDAVAYVARRLRGTTWRKDTKELKG